MEQSAEAFTCRVLRDAHRQNMSALLTVNGKMAGQACKDVAGLIRCAPAPPWSALLSSTSSGPCDPFCHDVAIHHSSVTVCYVGAGTDYQKCNARASEAAAALARHHIARRGDLIFFNEGLWHKTVSYSSTNLEAIVADLTGQAGSVLQSLLRSRGIGLSWRETSPQHFATQADGSYKSQSWYHDSRCGPHAFTARAPRRDELLARLEAAGLPVLKIWRATESQWDLHLEQKTPHTRAKPGPDCTHFCHPSGVMEAWVDGALLLAERILRNLKSTW